MFWWSMEGSLSLQAARRGCVSAHGQSRSSVAASPVRASPAGLSQRPAYVGARARRHRLRGTCWVPRCPPAPPPRPDRRARPPEPTWHDCRLRSHGPGEKQCGERETPRSQPREQRGGSEHRARARPPARSFSGLEWCRRFRFHRCRERRFPAGRPRRCLPSVQSAASSPALLSLSLLAGSRPGRSHAERASPQGHVQAEQRLAASAGS